MNTLAFPSMYRHVTPPLGVEYLQPNSAGSNRTASTFSFNDSPTSDITALTTPPRSPQIHRQNGTVLLPKVRSQDQNVDPVSTMTTHARHLSNCSMGSTYSFDFPAHLQRPMSQYGRSVSPPSQHPISTMGDGTEYINFGAPLPRPSSVNRARSLSRTSNHSRSSSVSNIDSAAIRKYVCPPQRSMSGYSVPQSSSLSQVSNAATSSASTPAQTCGPTLAPTTHFNSTTTNEAPSTSESAQQSALAPELLFHNYAELPEQTNLLQYLTEPNPSPALVRRTTVPNRQFDTSFWWDIRNVRTWHDFSLDTIRSIPGLSDLLEFPLPKPGLASTSATPNIHPETLSALHDAHTAHYATKVNAALQVALGTSPLSIRAHKPATGPGARQAPDFCANHPADYERTSGGEARSRVVGLVRSFDSWNSGMRTEGPAQRIAFLRELAALHALMRAHHSRYGYIITEIELVCVRAGADAVPYFGLLELAPPVQLKTTASAATLGESDTAAKMTAPLALWYLHMLAKNTPLPGQPGWRMDVGAPAALTRQRCLERDVWMVRPEGREKRDAKRNRGWVECTEPLSRKEIKPYKGGRRG